MQFCFLWFKKFNRILVCYKVVDTVNEKYVNFVICRMLKYACSLLFRFHKSISPDRKYRKKKSFVVVCMHFRAVTIFIKIIPNVLSPIRTYIAMVKITALNFSNKSSYWKFFERMPKYTKLYKHILSETREKCSHNIPQGKM